MRPSRDLPHRLQIRCFLIALLCVAGVSDHSNGCNRAADLGDLDDTRPEARLALHADGHGQHSPGPVSERNHPCIGLSRGSHNLPHVRLAFTVQVGLKTVDCTLRGTMEEGGDQIANSASCSWRPNRRDDFALTLVRTG